MLEKILVPVDGSELADRILVHARRVLVRKDAVVVLVRVIPERPTKDDDAVIARAHLDRLARELGSTEGPEVDARFLTGSDAAGRILEVAEEVRPSLIALSTHGRTGLKRFYRGSVAERVLRSSRFPVLLANPFALPERTREMGFRRILVPLDGSLESAKVLPQVHDFARIYESEVLLVHALEPDMSVEASSRFESHAEAAAMLEHHKKSLGGVAVRVIVLTGEPAAALLDAADRESADLIALTTHGRSGVSRWIYGSVAEHVLHHARVPLLVVRCGPGE
jgi:nucleotide-binding universal stress UspA family protein